MARVGLDLDGVLYDFSGELIKHIEKQSAFWKGKLTPPTTWRFYEEWDMSHETFTWYSRQAISQGTLFKEGDVIGGTETVDALRDLKTAGHEIIIVTARDFGEDLKRTIEERTIAWLDHNDIPYDELHFVEDKTSVQTDYFLDDRQENYTALVQAGVDAWLLNQPWNRGLDAITASRVDSVGEYVQLVLDGDCENCDGRKCMGCVFREYDHTCADDCPSCCAPQKPGPEFFEKAREILGSGEVRVTSSTGGQKGTKPARFDLLPQQALWQVAELYGKGAEKYDDNNWRRGYPFSLSYAALQRHASLFWQGQDNDEETGLPHMASVVFHALALLTFMQEHPEFDDRFKVQDCNA